MSILIPSIEDIREVIIKELKPLYKKIEALEKGQTLDLKEVCELTGYKKHTIYKLSSQEKIPFYKRPSSNKLIFRKHEILEWMKEKDK